MSHGHINISKAASYPSVSRLLRRVTLVWTADASGTADGEFTPGQNGELIRVLSVPGGPSGRPHDGYSIALVDRGGRDVLKGRGRNQAGARPIDLGPVGFISDPLELRVSGAGSGATGRVVLYVRGQDEAVR